MRRGINGANSGQKAPLKSARGGSSAPVVAGRGHIRRGRSRNAQVGGSIPRDDLLPPAVPASGEAGAGDWLVRLLAGTAPVTGKRLWLWLCGILAGHSRTSAASISHGWPFVGRAEDLAQATAAVHGSGGVVLVGPAGVGKTRLARQVLSEAGRRAGATRWIGATAAARSVPLGAFAALVVDCAGPADARSG